MLVSEAFEILKKEKNGDLTQVEFAKGMGSNPVSCNQRIKNKSELKVSEAIKLFDTFNYDFINHSVINSKKNDNIGKVEIKYYQNPNLVTDIKTPLITSIWFDRELVENVWKKDPKNLRIITMLGDKMDTGDYPLKNDDILIIDLSETDVTKSGIYAFTTYNEKYIFINGINRKYDGSYRFFFHNKSYPEKSILPEEIERVDMKIVGRIVKNLSLTI